MDLREIQAPISDCLRETDRQLKRHLSSDVPLVRKIARHTPVYKGKKIRSTLLFLLARLNGYSSDKLPAIAAAIEMFHLSSLVHDDIVDNSNLRRGERTLNNNLGNNISVLGGDFLFIRSLNMLNDLDDPHLIGIILKAAAGMIEGQLLELENSYNYRIQPRAYYSIVRKKTAFLFAGVAEIIALLLRLDNSRRSAYHRFGLNFGTMFQISDDMLDIFSNHSGKDRFRDLQEGKVTLPYILLIKQGGGSVVRSLKTGDSDTLLQLFEDYGIKKEAQKKLDRYYRDAVRFLDSFADSDHKASLTNLLRFTRDREY